MDDFAAYADVVFKALGPRVKFWTTFNGAPVTTLNTFGPVCSAMCLGQW